MTALLPKFRSSHDHTTETVLRLRLAQDRYTVIALSETQTYSRPTLHVTGAAELPKQSDTEALEFANLTGAQQWCDARKINFEPLQAL